MLSMSWEGADLVLAEDFFNSRSKYFNGSNDALWESCQYVDELGWDHHHQHRKKKPSGAPNHMSSYCSNTEDGIF